MEIEREEYLELTTFNANRRPLFTEILGLLIGLKEEWAVQEEILEETDEHIVARDHMGRRVKLPKGFATLPFDHYRFYIDKAWEILDREAAK